MCDDDVIKREKRDEKSKPGLKIRREKIRVSWTALP